MGMKRLPMSSKRILLLGVILLVLIVGVVMISNRKDSTNTKNLDYKQLAYQSQRYNIGLERRTNEKLEVDYYLNVQFTDSFAPKSQCLTIQPGFKGTITVRENTPEGMQINLTQNKKPYIGQPVTDERAPCPAVAMLPVAQTYKLNKAWLENSNPTKKVMIQNVEYTLVLDKSSYSLQLTGSGAKIAVAYIPDTIAALYTYPNKACSVDSVREFASSQNIQLAEAVYPELSSKLANQGFRLNATNQNSILVIINDAVKKLQGRQADGQPCQVFVSTDLNFGLAQQVISVGE